MVTTAAVAIPMGAGQASVRTAIADKLQGDVKTFAESLGEQAEMELFPGTAMNASLQTEESVTTKSETTGKIEIADGHATPITADETKTDAAKGFTSAGETVAATVAAGITASNAKVPSKARHGVNLVLRAKCPEPHSVGLSKASSNSRDDEVVVDLSTAVVVPARSVECDGGGQAQSAVMRSTGGNAEAVPEETSQTAVVTDVISVRAPVSVATAVQKASSPADHGTTVQTPLTTAASEKQPASSKRDSDKKQDTVDKTGVHQQDANAAGSVVVNAVQPSVVPALRVATEAAKSNAVTGAVVAPRAVFGKEAQAAAYKSDASVGKQNTAAQASVGGQRASTQQDGHAIKAGQETEKTTSTVVTAANDGVAKLTNATTVVAASPAVVAGGAVPGHVAGPAPFAKTQGGDAGAQQSTVHVGSETAAMGTAASPPPEMAHRTLSASPTTLEVGVPNGSEGWLKIRAEMASGGGVNASLSAASPAGQEMLHRELPSLTAFLQQERVAVNTVVVHPLPAAAMRAETGGMTGGMSGQAQQRSGQGGDGGRAMQGTSADQGPYPTHETVGADEILQPLHYTGGGSWLSVRA